ncbi:hypothetical protein GLE_0472 [Lysobacter enzymogenes]|uniref:Uncharacterized protein n=1 Tax=Lysobacter enzymogenes TaxID=69 RepID=A0A0S2DBC9_LYSEN|nr:hypothetical protein GLE_0472 [Lysobacter enzymogenes]
MQHMTVHDPVQSDAVQPSTLSNTRSACANSPLENNGPAG